jgi:hypothetical protein
MANVPVTWKVSALLDRLYGVNMWQTYRLAYGLQVDHKKPTSLRWAAHAITAQYDPTIQELFAGITPTHGQSHYLLISKLDVRLLYQLSDDPMSYDKMTKDQILLRLYELQDLYMHMPPPQPYPDTHHTPNPRKRDADGTPKHARLHHLLDALRGI